jgi:hypothetical protein
MEAREGRIVLEVPGVYSVEPGGGVIVVNLAREECALAPLAPEKLAALGVPWAEEVKGEGQSGEKAAQESPATLLAQELEARQGVWRWVLVGVIILLGIETFWAGRLSKNRRALV